MYLLINMFFSMYYYAKALSHLSLFQVVIFTILFYNNDQLKISYKFPLQLLI